MSKLALLALGINGIIGSGVFVLPGKLGQSLGIWAAVLFFVCGLMLTPIALVYAELSSRFDSNGGPYEFALKTLGKESAFPIGWLNWFTCIVSTSTVSSAFPIYLEYFFPNQFPMVVSQVLAGAMILLFAFINTFGIRYGSKTMTMITWIKIAPLVAIVIAAIPSFKEIPMSPLPKLNDLGGGILSILFLYTGFEIIPVVSGESSHSKKTVPWATVTSLFICVVFYVFIQSAVMAQPLAIGSEKPITMLAEGLWGGWGGKLIGLTGLISILGFISGSAITAPRMLMPIVEQGQLPRLLSDGKSEKKSLNAAIWPGAIVSAALCFFNTMTELLELATLAVAAQYLFSSLCLMKISLKEKKHVVLTVLSLLMSCVFLYWVPGVAWRGLFLALALGYCIRYFPRRGLVSV